MGQVILIDIAKGRPSDDPINEDTSMVETSPRIPFIVAGQLLRVVPENMQSPLIVFQKVAIDAQESAYQNLWGMLGGIVTQMVPKWPEKLHEEWQIKLIALLTNKTEDFTRKNFGDENLSA